MVTNATLRDSFRLTLLTAADGIVERDVSPPSELLAMLSRGEAWGEASIRPRDSDFPLVLVSFHHSHGFVLQCYEDERSWSDFLVDGDVISASRVEIVLGGQTMERWPSELFVSEPLVKEALAYFLDSGRQKPDLRWVRIDRFPRDVVWEGREGREAWEKAQRAHDAGGV